MATWRVASAHLVYLIFFNSRLKQVHSHKHLGIILHYRYSWEEHIDTIITRSIKRVNVLKGLEHILPRDSLETIYCTMIRPILEYGCVIYYAHETVTTLKLERVQYEAGKIVSGALKYSSYNKICLELGWPKISERAKLLKASLMFKIIRGVTPEYFSSYIINKSVRQGTARELRHHTNLTPAFSKTVRYEKSFVPSSVALWNSLPNTLQASLSLNSFKYQYKKIYFSPKIMATNLGERIPNVLLARFRLGFTTLNEDLYIRSLRNTPECNCSQGNETYIHYFLRCTFYTQERINLLRDVSEIFTSAYITMATLTDDEILNYLLFGLPYPFNRHNRDLFQKTHTYITATKRFQIHNQIYI